MNNEIGMMTAKMYMSEDYIIWIHLHSFSLYFFICNLTLEKVGCLNCAGIKSIIMSIVSKTNMDEIPDIIHEAEVDLILVLIQYLERHMFLEMLK